MAYPARSLQERFDAKYTPEPNSGCWLWAACVDKDGYGIIAFGTRGKKKEAAHRVSWEMQNGTIPHGLQVLHRCDNPSCVNPDHLHVGTGAENHADKARRDRSPFGERQGGHKLTEQQVIAVLHDERPQTTIASDYGVSQSAISLIKRGQNWARVYSRVIGE